jgi:CheY-like chemotaxis protein
MPAALFNFVCQDLEIFNFFMRERRVLGWRSSMAVAPLSPSMRHLLLFKTCSMYSRSISSRERPLLGGLGYHVTVRSSAKDTLILLKKKPEKFDLIITDQVMPVMTGSQLAKAVIEMGINIPVILCTGFAEQMQEIHAEDSGIKAIVKKPILKHYLASIIRKVLDVR